MTMTSLQSWRNMTTAWKHLRRHKPIKNSRTDSNWEVTKMTEREVLMTWSETITDMYRKLYNSKMVNNTSGCKQFCNVAFFSRKNKKHIISLSMIFRANCLLRRQFAWHVRAYFLGKIRKISSICLLLKFLPSMLSIKHLLFRNWFIYMCHHRPWDHRWMRLW